VRRRLARAALRQQRLNQVQNGTRPSAGMLLMLRLLQRLQQRLLRAQHRRSSRGNCRGDGRSGEGVQHEAHLLLQRRHVRERSDAGAAPRGLQWRSCEPPPHAVAHCCLQPARHRHRQDGRRRWRRRRWRRHRGKRRRRGVRGDTLQQAHELAGLPRVAAPQRTLAVESLGGGRPPDGAFDEGVLHLESRQHGIQSVQGSGEAFPEVVPGRPAREEQCRKALT